MQRYIKIFYQKVKFYFFINYFLFIFAEIKYETMEAKEKAKELFDKYDNILYKEYNNLEAKQCALIAVDEIINSSPSLPILGDGGTYGEDIELSTKYYQEVKEEILKLKL